MKEAASYYCASEGRNVPTRQPVERERQYEYSTVVGISVKARRVIVVEVCMESTSGVTTLPPLRFNRETEPLKASLCFSFLPRLRSIVYH